LNSLFKNTFVFCVQYTPAECEQSPWYYHMPVMRKPSCTIIAPGGIHHSSVKNFPLYFTNPAQVKKTN